MTDPEGLIVYRPDLGGVKARPGPVTRRTAADAVPALVHDLETRTTVRIDRVPVAAVVRFTWAGPLIARLRHDDDRPLDLLDAATGRVERRLATAVISMASSHDGTLVWVEADGSIHRLVSGGVPMGRGVRARRRSRAPGLATRARRRATA